MTKSKKSVFALVIATATIAILTSSISLSNTAEAQSGKIPEWIQNIALFWGEGQISESEFVNALEFLGDEGILRLPAAESAEAQEITTSLRELEQRIEEVESKQTTESTTEPTRDPESGDSSYPTSAICPSDKIRHFDKIHFKLNLGTNQKAFNSEGYDALSSNWTYIVILEERYDEIGIPFGVEEKLLSHLHELGYYSLLNDETPVGIPIASVEILDVEYAVICANKPGLSQSSGTLGYK